jgi:diaminohydroxyphosphoribosylaminopyrimidine deaminase/5-amino-6-(5-phosphoribosylamino)uracil reductase
MTEVFSAFDIQCMSRAIQLARRGWFTAAPNPRVGCVLAKEGRIVGEGFHRKAGEAHAEINAINEAGDKAGGAVAYVTLEPCNHQGRTGPCSEALITAGVSEVVYAMADPHKTAAGGIQRLKEAGIRVRGPLLESEAVELNPGFVKRCVIGLPRVTLKLAMSLDGRTAMASGESQWITGPEARCDVQRLRAQSDAIVTGIGTVLADNPAMTVRATQLPKNIAGKEEIAKRQPLRVVIDSQGRMPADAAMVGQGGNILLATAVPLPEPLQLNNGDVASNKVDYFVAQDQQGKVDLRALMTELAEKDCNEVLVEAGPGLAGAMVAAGLVDELVIYIAGKLMGSRAMPLLSLPFDTMAEALELDIADIRAVGKDWRVTARPRNVEK